NSTFDLFGAGGGEETASRLSTLVGADIPLLSKIPFDPQLREGGDQGEAIIYRAPQSPAAQEFSKLAEKIAVRKRSLLGVRLGLST
ncbi:MAG: sodium:proton antiporter, partial [Actinobacteria bacterium]|nr:sodium:proton antiporter [Actinomycetota bacterium]